MKAALTHNLRISLLQAVIEWENPSANLAHYDELMAQLEGPTDLIILPEMFTTAFTMHPAGVAEGMDGPTVDWMRRKADNFQAAITGSLVIEEEGRYYNRLIWMYPSGEYRTYDKRHLFTMAGEHESYVAGEERLIVEHRGWRICPMICYDLRFPVWARNDDAYDLLIYLANWPDRRSYDWRTLLRARAIENQVYVVGVNRVGTDANGHNYRGDSCVIDPGWRHVLFEVAEKEAARTVELSADHLVEVRKKLPFLADRDTFRVMT